VKDSRDSLQGRPADQARPAEDLLRANEQLRRELALLKEVEQQVICLNREVEDTQREVIFRLAEIVEARSRETGGHVMRVAELSQLLALKCGLARRETELLRAAAPMHDVGKVGIPDAILFNPGRLSSEEFEVMKTHTTIGYKMLKGSSRPILTHAAVIALQHHEKFNGTGYPLGLKGQQIHIFGRIVAIADVFDALSSDRIYRKAWEIKRILAYFERQRGECFDPDLLDLFLGHFDDFVSVLHAFPTTRPDLNGDAGVIERATDEFRDLAQLTGCRDSAAEGSDASAGAPDSRSVLGARARGAQLAGGGDARDSQSVTRILVADDDPASREALEATLDTWGYDVVVCEKADQVDLVLRQEGPPKLAIVSRSLDGNAGLDVCRMIRRREGDYVYIILLADADRADQTAEGMSAGADACVHKPIGEEELRARLSAAERILTLQDQLLSTQRSLREQASHDALTGLWNRRAILNIFRNELDRAKREDISIAVIMADLDKFKSINDTYGHQAGDIVLREASQRMRTVTRPYDMVGRYGGEEFIVIVPRCDSTFAAYIADRIRTAVSAEPVCLHGHERQLTVSLGVAAIRGIEDTDADALVKAADAALYRAKHEGRDRVCVAEMKIATL